MALINIDAFGRIEKNKNHIHDKVEATYSVFEDNGNKYFQIDSYGKSTREVPGKVSQSLQIDRKAAEVIVDIVIAEFDLKPRW